MSEIPEYGETHGHGRFSRSAFAEEAARQRRRFGSHPGEHRELDPDPIVDTEPDLAAIAWERRAVEAETQLTETRDEQLTALLFDEWADRGDVAEAVFSATEPWDERRSMAIEGWAAEDPDAAEGFLRRGHVQATLAEAAALDRERTQAQQLAAKITGDAFARLAERHRAEFERAPELRDCFMVALEGEAASGPENMTPGRIDSTFEAAFRRGVEMHNAAARTEGMHAFRQQFSDEIVRQQGLRSDQARGVKPMPTVPQPTLADTLGRLPDHPDVRRARREQNQERFRAEFKQTAERSFAAENKPATQQSPSLRAQAEREREQREAPYRRLLG
jgi:hypothetical protein